MNQPDTRSCPYCGGEIKTAASICKHCKQPVSAPGMAPRLSGVDVEVQQLLVSRGLLTETQFDGALARRGQADDDLLEFLSGQGLITGAQAQNVRASLRTQAIGEANRLGRIALDKMFITQDQFEQALQVVQSSPDLVRLPDVLLKLGFVTVGQRDTLIAERAPEAPPGRVQQTAPVPPGGAMKPGLIYPTGSRTYFNWGFVVLTFLLPGIGQLVLGQVGIGIIFLVVGIAVNIAALASGFAIFVALVVSVNSAARYYRDAKSLDQGRPVKFWTGPAE